MSTKYLYLNTIGCQMNVYDSEQIAKGLKALEYHLTSSLETADLIIVNTCAIRAKAEQKAFSFLGRLAAFKKKKPDLIIGMGGCVAQQEGKKILKRLPHLDLVFGTHAIGRLPMHIQRIEKEKCRIVDIEMSEALVEFGSTVTLKPTGKATSFVTIMQGCDNYCTYCVVPYVRGREKSRNPENIIQEIQNLVKSGVREVTLLGQNVNSYGQKEKLCSFPELLQETNKIKGLLRIRFTTSHPKDLSEDLILAFKDIEKLCKHIHLPIQTGSNRILKKMNRKYTRESYLQKIERLRHICPDIAITSDIIVGFPGETEADFKETLDLIKTVEYDNLFSFKYSDRPNAASACFPSKISKQEKNDRLQRLLELQEYFTLKKNKALVGSDQSILIEGSSKKHKAVNADHEWQWMGRTSTNRIVNFSQTNDDTSFNKVPIGQLIKVRIEKAFSHSLWAKPIRIEQKSVGLKGEESYAA
ncbi:MAG: tRNA (N6-isopentenyl adenosine(37)-C2)-methylthiotransferase MiaB [Desulfobacterales bacterium]|nr:tRNA (N6-isopentenyl adenosine(37)-C2)-methylthiotransferase MiaB [Desulfobacterales bacterium]